jgi:hypothetical protein
MTDADSDILPIADLEDPAHDGSGSRRSLPVLWIAVALILGVGLASVLLRVVGGDDQTPEERFAAIPTALTDAQTFAYEMHSTTSAAGTSFTMQLTGVADAATKRGRATMDLGGRKVTMVTDGDTAYVQVPAEARGFSQGKGWMRISTAGLTSGGSTGVASGTDPLATLRSLAAPGARIEELGSEDVRGTATTHFRTHLDLTKNLPAATAQMAPPSMLESLKNVPVDVWLDDDNRPRRYTTDLDLSVPGAGTAKSTFTLESFDYGKPVDIELPDPADVADGDPTALGALFGGGS